MSDENRTTKEERAEWLEHLRVCGPSNVIVQSNAVNLAPRLVADVERLEALLASCLADCEAVRKVASEALRGPGADLAGEEAQLVSLVVAERDDSRVRLARAQKAIDSAHSDLARAMDGPWAQGWAQIETHRALFHRVMEVMNGLKSDVSRIGEEIE